MTEDATPSAPGYPRPLINQDNAFLYEGFEQAELRIQQCSECHQLRFPPGPMCLNCQSMMWTVVCANGKGHVHSFTVQHHPPIPPFQVPHAVVLVDLEEGIRFLASIRNVSIDDIFIGMEVELDFHELEPGFKLPVFRPASTNPNPDSPET